MKLISRLLPVAAMLLLCAGNFAAAQNETLEKAVGWLLEQQDESGAFKSKHYGAMKQGAAITSLALYSLSGLPEKIRREQTTQIDLAFEFLVPGTTKRGQVANPDGSLDHPVYSTAMFLVAAKRTNRQLDRELLRTLLKFLVDSQCAEGRGFQSEEPNYGGWDVLGPAVMPGKTSGTNVSVTRFVLEAFECWVPFHGDPDQELLNSETIDLVNASRKKARKWIERLHAACSDKGFIFTAQPGSALNKSKDPDGKPRSYSSSTCDGLIVANLANGGRWTDEYQQSLKWLVENVKSARVAGFDDSDSSGWFDALQFYHLQALVSVVPKYLLEKRMPPAEVKGWDREWLDESKAGVLAVLAERQKPDGSFSNDSSLMRENDPLIATSFAIIALGSLEP